LTILDVFYDASVAFYRCTLFHIALYAAFNASFRVLLYIEEPKP